MLWMIRICCIVAMTTAPVTAQALKPFWSVGQKRKGPIGPFCYSPNGKLLAYVNSIAGKKEIMGKQYDVGIGLELHVINMGSRKEVRRWESGKELSFSNSSLVFTPDGTGLAIPDTNGIKIVDLKEGKVREMLTGSEDGAGRLARVSTDGKIAGVTLGLAGQDIKSGVVVWKLGTEKPLKKWELLKGNVEAAVFSASGKTLAISWRKENKTPELVVFNTTTWKALRQFPVDALNAPRIAFAPNGLYLACRAKELMIYNLKTSKPLPIKQTFSRVRTFTSDSKFLVASGSTRPRRDALKNPLPPYTPIEFINLRTGRSSEFNIEHPIGTTILDAAISPNGKTLMVGCGVVNKGIHLLAAYRVPPIR